MSALVIFDGAGPLPVTAKFDSPLDGPAVFVLTATAWTQSAPILTGVYLVLDGNAIGSAAMCWANLNAVHLAMRPTFIDVADLSYGSHTIEIVNASGDTITDLNDYFQVTLLY